MSAFKKISEGLDDAIAMTRATRAHNNLNAVLKVLPTDYSDFGGEVVRWQDGDDYPDCSSGCKWAYPLSGALGMDWVVCANPKSPRRGLLTFEHQAGRGCFEPNRRRAREMAE